MFHFLSTSWISHRNLVYIPNTATQRELYSFVLAFFLLAKNMKTDSEIFTHPFLLQDILKKEPGLQV